MEDNSIIEVALQLVALAAKIAPPIAAWLRDLIDGRSDFLSKRVRDILPEESQSAVALREIGG